MATVRVKAKDERGREIEVEFSSQGGAYGGSAYWDEKKLTGSAEAIVALFFYGRTPPDSETES